MYDSCKADLINLKNQHLNVLHILKRCNTEGEECLFVGRLIDTVKNQFDFVEKVSRDMDFDFPIKHYREHRELILRLEKREDEYKNNDISLTDFIEITYNFYYLHYVTFGELLYADMLSHCNRVNIAV